MSDNNRQYIFLERAVLLGTDNGMRRRFLVEKTDGILRWATGDDLIAIREHFPDFFKRVKAGHFEEDE